MHYHLTNPPGKFHNSAIEMQEYSAPESAHQTIYFYSLSAAVEAILFELQILHAAVLRVPSKDKYLTN